MLKRILFVLLLSTLLIGCDKYNINNGNINMDEESKKTLVLYGTVIEKHHHYHTSHVDIQTEDGIKVHLYERYSSFSNPYEVGDLVAFRVEENDSGYRIIGIKFD